MALQLFLELLMVVAAFLFVRHRRSLFWAILIFISVLLCGTLFFESYPLFDFKSSSFSLFSYRNLKSEFVILSDPTTITFIKNIFPLLLMLLWSNIFHYSEEYSLSAANIMILLFICVIFTASSQDFIQLMVGSSCFSILGFFLIRDFLDKNKFVFYSFFAEMSLFIALAVVYSQTGDISLKKMSQYIAKGHHQDLVSILVLISIFAKCAMFLFQDQLIELSRINWQRVLSFSILGNSICGLIIYNKLSSLVFASSYGFPILKIIIVLSVIWGLIEIFRTNSINLKNLILNMMIFASYLWLMYDNKYFMQEAIHLLCIIFICNWICIIPSLKSKEHLLWFSTILPLLSVVIYQFKSFDTYTIAGTILYFLVFLLSELAVKNSKTTTVKANNDSQSYLSAIYGSLFLSPLRLLGRILWLAVDFIVIERSLIGTFSNFSDKVFLFCNKIQESTLKNWVILVLLGLGIMLFSLGIYAYE